MIIAHLDMDAFFAACEERANPQFTGLGIIVGADPKLGTGRGVVSTANYQARKYGIHSAMPITTAWRLSQNALKRGEPKTVFLPVNGSYYSQVSDRIFTLVRKYVRTVEQTSIDEAYLDLSSRFPQIPQNPQIPNTSDRYHLVSEQQGYNEAEILIRRIKNEISATEKLTASVGIGPNKLIAKMASAKYKPDGLTVIKPDEVEEFLDPLPIGDIPGLGPKSEEFFHQKNIYKISQLKQIAKDQLQMWAGKWGEDIWEKAHGIDDSLVTVEREIKSISEQETFEKDTASAAFILDELNKLASRVIERMHNDKISSFKTVTIVVRFADFITKNRAHTLKDYTDSLTIFRNEAIKLILPFLDRRENPKKKLIRLIGVGIEGFDKESPDQKKAGLPKQQITQNSLF